MEYKYIRSMRWREVVSNPSLPPPESEIKYNNHFIYFRPTGQGEDSLVAWFALKVASLTRGGGSAGGSRAPLPPPGPAPSPQRDIKPQAGTRQHSYSSTFFFVVLLDCRDDDVRSSTV